MKKNCCWVNYKWVLIQANQHKTDSQNLEKTIGDVESKIPEVSGLAATAVLNTKIGEVGNKIPDIKKFDINRKFESLATKAELKAEIVKYWNSEIVKQQTHGLSYFRGKIFLVTMIFRICLFIKRHLIH